MRGSVGFGAKKEDKELSLELEVGIGVLLFNVADFVF